MEIAVTSWVCVCACCGQAVQLRFIGGRHEAICDPGSQWMGVVFSRKFRVCVACRCVVGIVVVRTGSVSRMSVRSSSVTAVRVRGQLTGNFVSRPSLGGFTSTGRIVNLHTASGRNGINLDVAIPHQAGAIDGFEWYDVR